MKSLDYYITEAEYEMPGSLSQEDFVDAVACMDASEWKELNAAIRDYNHAAATIAIRLSICRQHREKIDERALREYREAIEGERAEAEEQQAEVGREKRGAA